MKVRHQHNLLRSWIFWLLVQNIGKSVTIFALKWRIYFDFLTLRNVNNVMINWKQLIDRHVFLIHQINANLDHAVVEVDVVSAKLIRARLENAEKLRIVNVILEDDNVFAAIP